MRQVKELKPNQLGIYDMSGNVYEWTHTYHSEFRFDRYLLKGGSAHDYIHFLNISRAFNNRNDVAGNLYGFRLYRNADKIFCKIIIEETIYVEKELLER